MCGLIAFQYYSFRVPSSIESVLTSMINSKNAIIGTYISLKCSFNKQKNK